MAQLVIPQLDDAVVNRLVQRAAARGHSLEEEVRDILTRAIRLDQAAFREAAAAIRARQRARPQTDSVELLREDRDR